MRAKVAFVSCFVALASANTLSTRQEGTRRPLGYSTGWQAPGFLYPSLLPEKEEFQLFEAAGRQPNFTNSVSFQFAPGNLSESEADTTWTWFLNTTDIALPDDVSPRVMPGARVLNQQWALQWPGGGNLQSSIDRWGLQDNTTSGLCFGTATWAVPSNISSRYSNARPGNCSAVVGAECAAALLAQPFVENGGRCGVLSSDFDECADSIGSQGSAGIGGFGWANSSDTFWAETTRADRSAEERQELYDSSLTSLHVLLVADVSSGSPTVSGSGSNRQLLCQIVDPPESSGASLRVNVFVVGVSLLAMAWAVVPY